MANRSKDGAFSRAVDVYNKEQKQALQDAKRAQENYSRAYTNDQLAGNLEAYKKNLLKLMPYGYDVSKPVSDINVMLPKVTNPLTSGGGGGGRVSKANGGAGGYVNALAEAQKAAKRVTARDFLSDPLLAASKLQENLLDPIADAGWRITHPNAAREADEKRIAENLALPEARKPKAGKALEGWIVKGADKGLGTTASAADWLLGNAMKELGWENNPISAWNEAAKANRAANEVYYGKNMANATRAQKTIDTLATEAVAALPDLVIAYLTGGGSAAAEMGALAKGGAKLAGREAAAQTQNVVKRVVSELYRKPQYWTSFARAAGASYEQAKEDGASDWETNMYVLANGLLNAAVEVGGGIEVLPAAMRKSENALLSWIKSNAEEGTEEVVQGVIERGLQNLIYGKNNPLVSVKDENAVFNPLTSAKEFGGGFAVGGILSGGPAILNAGAAAERGRVNRALRDAQTKAPPVQGATVRTMQNVENADQEAVQVLRDLMDGKEVSQKEIRTLAENREMSRNLLKAMGTETAEDASVDDLAKLLNKTAAQMQGKTEEWARSQLSEADRARYDAAETETARSGILSGASDETIGIAERLSQVLGRKIVFASRESTWGGGYDKGTGVITLNANAKNPVAQIIGHELTHAIEEAGESYTKLAQLVSQRIAKTGDLSAYRKNIQETYAANGTELDETGLDHEMVAKYIEENLLTNEEEITSLVQQDRTLGQRIRDLLNRILAKLGSKNAAERAFIQRARDLYAQALEAAPITSRQQIRELNDRYRRGEISEAEYDAEFDRVYDAEDALRADVQNSFAGENAKTADLEQLRAAKEMLAEDVAPETIRQQTGWFQGADGKWRFEIDDSGMRYYANGNARGKQSVRSSWFEIADREKALRKELKSEEQKGLLHEFQEIVRHAESEDAALEDERLGEIWERLSSDAGQKFDQWAIDYIRFMKSPFSDGDLLRNTLADYISHDQLFEAYPELRDTSLVFEEMPKEQKGRYSKAEDTIYLNSELRNAPEKTLLHEIQHILQSVEGFSNGSSPAAWNRRIEQGYDNRTESAKAEQRRLQEQMNQLREDDPEFFDEFAELYHGSPSVPRGEVDFDTLEQITEDPPEWQAWDAQRDAMEEKYGNRIWDAFRLFDAFRQAEMNPQRRDADELYRNTAGEIEARDVTSRRKMTAEERKNTPPDTGDEDTVFADGAGRAEDFVPGDIDAETVSNGVLEVSKMEPVKEITGKEFEAGSKDLITQVSEFFEEIGGMIVNPQLGDVILNRRGAKADLAHGIGREKAAAFAAVPDVLEKGKVIDFQKNWKGRGLDTAVIAAPITIGGKPYLAGVVLRRSASENRFYLHEVLAEKNEALPFKTGTSKGTPGGNAPSVKSLLQKVYEVKHNNGIPAPPKSSTTQNSYSAKPAEGVELPKAEEKTQEERLPKEAQTYLQRAHRRTMEKIAYALHIQNAESREFLKGPLTDATEEYLRSGKISEEKRRKLFDAAWDEGRVILDDFYNDHKHIRDMIRTTPLNAESVKGDIADYGAFRRQHMGTLKLVSNGGSNIDTFYDELHEIEPGLFPQSENNTHDRLMKILEVAQSIQKVEQSLDQHYGEEADTMRMYAENDFEAYMDELSSELRQVKRYEADKAEAEQPEPITAETVTQAYRDLKDQRRTYEKTAAKNLLTEADEVAVGRILRGEDTVEGLNPRKYNVRGIRDVVEAKREYEKTARRIREYKAQQRKARRDMADTYLGTVMSWKDKKIGAAYSRETMERNIRDIAKDKAEAQKIIDAYFTPVHKNEADATRMKNTFRERVKAMNLSREIAKGNTVSEAHAVQLLGEATDNMRYLEEHKRVKERDGKPYEEWQRVVNALWDCNPNLNKAKIEKAVEDFRAIYDELFQQMNEVRIRNGYEPINYRKGYFPHFQPGDSSGLLEQFSRALGISADVTSLPTTINGLTHQFRPGIRWFGNAQERLGFNTTYDAVEGFDKYIEGAADVIHHTDDIQNLRALSDQIRYRASDQGVREQVDRIRKMDNLTEAEKNTLIGETYDKGKYHLGNFVVELEEYTNLLANKRSRRDRDMEQMLGRNMYNLAKRFESRVAANMVAINPGSWLTNFIPLTQGWTTTGSKHLLQGAFETLRNVKASDGMVEKSAFLTNRRGSDPLVKMWEQSSKAPTKWQKINAFGGKAGEILSSPMEYIDQFTAGTLVRARYNQNLERGLSEQAAIDEADAWTAGIMADRSKGSTPTVFQQQNPLKKVFTQFQLEVNNELSWLAKDVPDELKKKSLGAAALAIFKFLIGSYLFNDLYEALVGRRSALDPLGILNDTVGDLTGYQLPNVVDLMRGEDDFKTKKKDLYDTVSDVGEEVAENLPFIGGVLGGGRVPISSALPNLDNVSKAVGKSGLSGKKRAQLLGKELGNTAAYVVLPFGGGQIKKIAQGVNAVAQGGSYSVDKDGNKLLQYPVYNDSTGAVVANTAKAVLFGKSSLRGAREWVENDFDSFGKKETEAYRALTKDGVKQKDAYELMKQLHDVSGDKVKQQKSDIIRNSEISDDQKQALYKALLIEKDSNLDDKFTALRKTGMSWEQVMETYDEYRRIKDADGKANTRGTEFAVWADEHFTETQAAAVKEQFKIWQMMPANTDRYESFTASGLSSKESKQLTDALAALVPPEGKDQTTYLQRYEAVVSSGVSEKAQTAALRQLVPDTVLPKYEQTVKYEVSAAQYVQMYAATERLKEKYKKSSVNQDIAEEAINSIPGLSKKQKAVLWQIQNKSWKGSKNPYDTSVGWAVYKVLNNIDESAVMLP